MLASAATEADVDHPVSLLIFLSNSESIRRAGAPFMTKAAYQNQKAMECMAESYALRAVLV
jgi:hypothetical protein